MNLLRIATLDPRHYTHFTYIFRPSEYMFLEYINCTETQAFTCWYRSFYLYTVNIPYHRYDSVECNTDTFCNITQRHIQIHSIHLYVLKLIYDGGWPSTERLWIIFIYTESRKLFDVFILLCVDKNIIHFVSLSSQHKRILHAMYAIYLLLYDPKRHYNVLLVTPNDPLPIVVVSFLFNFYF